MDRPPPCCWIFNDSFCLTSIEWTAWAQGIGSLLAVAVAIAIPFLLRRADRISRHWAEAERLSKSRLLYLALEGECAVLAGATEPNRGPMNIARNIRGFNKCVEWIEELKVCDFPDASTMRTHLLLAAEFFDSRQLINQIPTIQLHTNDGKVLAKTIRNTLIELQSHAEYISDSFAAHERRLTAGLAKRFFWRAIALYRRVMGKTV